MGSITTVTYTYTGDDLRATRTVAGTTTGYVWDRQAGMPELVDDGTTISLQTNDGIQSEIVKSTNAASYGLLDGQGSVRAETNESGSATGSAAYDPWGNARGSISTSTNSGWAGERRDGTTGLTYPRARDYDPLRGRFTARDTVSPNAPGTQGYNPYAYTANNPVTLLDPSGHAVGVGASTGAAAGIMGAMGNLLDVLSILPTLPPAAQGWCRR